MKRLYVVSLIVILFSMLLLVACTETDEFQGNESVAESKDESVSAPSSESLPTEEQSSEAEESSDFFPSDSYVSLPYIEFD